MGLASCAVWVATVLLSVAPVGDAKPVTWGKNTGYQLGAITLESTGPKVLVLEVFVPAKTRQVSVTVLRDGRYRSLTEAKTGRARGPKGKPLAAKVAVQVPAGKHTYKISSSVEGVLAAEEANSVPKRVTVAAAETDEAPPAPAPDASPSKAAKAQAEAGTKDGAAVANLMNLSTAAAKTVGAETPGNDLEAGNKTNLLQAMRVAVYDLETDGIEPNIARVATDSLLAEMRKLQGVSAIGMDEIRDMLSFEADKQMLGCESDESCLAEIAGALGVDDLVTGKLSKVDDGGAVFLVRRIDQKRAKVAGVVNRRLTVESGEEFLAAIGPAVEELFPERPLREGLERGVPKEMGLRLNPPPLPTWSFLTVAGVAVAAAAAGGVFGLLTTTTQSTYDDLAASGTNDNPVDGKELNQVGERLQTNALTANILFSTAGAMALAAGVMAFFTDWHGYGDVEASK